MISFLNNLFLLMFTALVVFTLIAVLYAAFETFRN